MAINYAVKYSEKVDEEFKAESFTAAAVNDEYDFVGVKTVNVYSIPTVPLNDYQRSGTSRYGTPTDLQNTVQEMTLSQDRSFSFVVDKGDESETMMTLNAGKALVREVDDEITPEIDKYRISTFVANAGGTATAAITSANAYTAFLTGVAALKNAKVPVSGRVAFVSTNFYNSILTDPNFIKQGDTSQDMTIRGAVGTVADVTIITPPDDYLPANTEFVITHPDANVSPVKLLEYKLHVDPPGISGNLGEGRVIYDCFTLSNKAGATYAHMSA